MYAVLKTGGKQYKVEKGKKIIVEKLDAEIGKTVEIKDILMLNDGKQLLLKDDVKASKVVFKVEKHFKDDKVLILKKRRRKNSRRLNGHRQNYTLIEAVDIKI